MKPTEKVKEVNQKLSGISKKGVIGEFKEFISKGNVLDLAVGVIIGGAFQGIVKSLVDDILMPVIGLLTKDINCSNLFIALDGNKYDTLALAEAVEAPIITYGNFISALINFLIMAVVIFCLVKFFNKIARPAKPVEEVAAPRTCPFCRMEISDEATRCPHCTSVLDDPAEEVPTEESGE